MKTRGFYLKLAIAIILVLTATFFFRFLLVSTKTVVTHDEAISYLAAAGKQDDYGKARSSREFLGKFIPAHRWKNFLRSERFFNFSNINESLGKGDVHPPFYFWLLHIWNHFSELDIQTGAMLNIVLSLFTAVVVFAYGYYLSGSILLAFLASLIWSFSYAWSATYYVRQYELFGLVSIIFFFLLDYLTAEATNNQKQKHILLWSGLAVSTAAGMLTHVYFFVPLAGGVLFGFVRAVRLSPKMRNALLIKLALSLIAAVLLALALFPQYPGLIKKLLARSGPKDFSPTRSFHLKNSFRTFFFGITGRLADIPEYPYSSLFKILIYFFSGTAIGVLIFRAHQILQNNKFLQKNRPKKKPRKRDKNISFFPIFIIFWNLLIFTLLHVNLVLADWAIGERYYAHIYPLLGLSLFALFRNEKNKKKSGKKSKKKSEKKSEKKKFFVIPVVLGALWLTILLSGNFAYLNQKRSVESVSPSVIFTRTQKIVCDNTARGDLFGLLFYLPDSTSLYVDTQEKLIENAKAWAPALNYGDMYIGIVSYDSEKEKQAEIVDAFQKTTGKQFKYYSGYVSNVSLYVVTRK